MNRFFACSTLAVATSLLAVPAVAQDSVVADSEAIVSANLRGNALSGEFANCHQML